MLVLSAALCFFIQYARLCFSCVTYEALYRNYHCSCVPANTEVSNLWGCLHWYHSQKNAMTLPVTSCKRLMRQHGRGQLEYLKGQGKVVEVSAVPASQLSSITTNRCWQLNSLGMQSNHLGSRILLTGNSRAEVPSPGFPQSCQWRSFSKQRLRVPNLHRD